MLIVNVHSPLLQQFDGVIEISKMNLNNINEQYWDLLKTLEEVHENRETCAVGLVKSSPTGILPCQNEFGGSANFEVFLDSSCQSYRHKWIYSDTLKKLFIDINKVLLLNFKCDYEKIASNMSLFVRAMPMYTSADSLKEPVNRCLHHLSPMDKLNTDCTHLEHVIRCDNENSIYYIDEGSRRKSVVTLLSRPEHGSDSTILSYRFVCKNSCISGMDRRPIIVIFTLEDYTGQVLGRRILSVRICAEPKRGMEREETVFFENKKCISQKINHDNKHHHHSDSEPGPAKRINLESSTSAENTNLLHVNYTTKKKEHYKIVLESVYSIVAGASSLHNITTIAQ